MRMGGRGRPRRIHKQHPDRAVVSRVDITSVAPPNFAPSDTFQVTVQVNGLVEGIVTPLSGRTVTYATSNGSVATVNGSGLVTGAGVGTCTITATCEGCSTGLTNPATVVVSTPQNTVASVTVLPTTATVAPNAGVTLEARARDSGGNVLTSKTVTWGSSDTNKATVSADSGDENHRVTVTGVANGSANITATCDGVNSGTGNPCAVTVATPSNNEPAGMTQILDHAFSTLSGGGMNWYFGATTIVTDASDPVSPSNVARVVDENPYSGYGSYWEGPVVPSSPVRTKYYVRTYWKPQAAWIPHNVEYKFFYPTLYSDRTPSHEHGLHWDVIGSGGDRTTTALRTRLVPQTSLGASAFYQNVDASAQILRDQYNTLELYMEFNTPGTANGIAKWWINGVLVASHTDVGFCDSTMTNPRWYVPRVVLYAGGGTDPNPLPADQYSYLGHIYMSVA